MTEETIFVAALERHDAAERQAYLDQACAGDAALRRRIEALLRSHEGTDAFLQRPILEQLAGTIVGASAEEKYESVLRQLEPPSQPNTLGRLKHYEMREILGQGAFGTVFKAFDERLQRIVAVKVLAPRLAASDLARERFTREARAAAAIRHDNVINIYAVEDEPIPYLVMEYIDGPTLQEKLDRHGPLPLPEVLRIGAQTAAGLAAAHKQGLVHRDIKPSNILLENGVERVKITDFGLARPSAGGSLTQKGVVAGTPEFMSPEQALGEPVDARSDLFSLGSVLYALCAGASPFAGGSVVAILKKVCEETPAPLHERNPAVPPTLAADISRLLAKQPTARFASATEVSERLFRLLAQLQGETLEREPVQRQAPVKPIARSKPWRLLAGLALAGLACVLIIWLVVQPPWQPVGVPGANAPAPVANVRKTWPADALKQGEVYPALLPELGRLADGVPHARVALLGKGPFLHRDHGPNSEVAAVAYSADGKVLASTNARHDPGTKSFAGWEVMLWEADTGKPLRQIGTHAAPVHALAFSPEGRLLVTGCRDGTVKVWDADTGKEQRNLEGLAPGLVRGVAWSPDGRWIAACAVEADERVLVWEAATGKKKLACNQHR
jgi:hypothetical protein